MNVLCVSGDGPQTVPAIALAMTNFFIGRRTDIDDLDVECRVIPARDDWCQHLH